MSRTVYEPGDVVGYPKLDSLQDRTMTVLDRRIMRFKSGKIYIRYLCKELIDRFVEDIKTNLDREYDNLIVIQGKEGSGKSNFCYQLCKRLDPEFDMEWSYTYSYDEFVEKITQTDVDDRHKVYWMDEGSLIANNRESLTEDSRNLVALLETMRSRGWTMVLSIPSADRLDKYIREYRMRYLVTALETSWSMVYTEPQRGFFELRFRGSRGSYDSFYTVGYGVFDKIPDEEKKVYERLKKRSQDRLLQKIVDSKDPDAKKKKTAMGKRQDKFYEGMLQVWERGDYSREDMRDMFGYTSNDLFSSGLKDAKERRRIRMREEGKSEEEIEASFKKRSNAGPKKKKKTQVEEVTEDEAVGEV